MFVGRLIKAVWIDDEAPVLYCGEPQGRFAHIVHAANELNASAVVLLGDLELLRPIHEESVGNSAPTGFIHGNHDTDSDEMWTRVWESDVAERNIHAKVLGMPDGTRRAGLGGVVRESVWYSDRLVDFKVIEQISIRYARHRRDRMPLLASRWSEGKRSFVADRFWPRAALQRCRRDRQQPLRSGPSGRLDRRGDRAGQAGVTRLRRRAAKPTTLTPAIIIATDAGSGTGAATGGSTGEPCRLAQVVALIQVEVSSMRSAETDSRPEYVVWPSHGDEM